MGEISLPPQGFSYICFCFFLVLFLLNGSRGNGRRDERGETEGDDLQFLILVSCLRYPTLSFQLTFS